MFLSDLFSASANTISIALIWSLGLSIHSVNYAHHSHRLRWDLPGGRAKFEFFISPKNREFGLV